MLNTSNRNLDTALQQPKQKKSITMATWYYYNENGKKVGPIRGRDLTQLVQQGTITRKTILEDSEGRTGLAGKAKGLTFPETVQSSPPLPVEPNPFTAPLPETENPFVGTLPTATISPQSDIVRSSDIFRSSGIFRSNGTTKKKGKFLRPLVLWLIIVCLSLLPFIILGWVYGEFGLRGAEKKQAALDISQFDKALEVYKTEHGRYPYGRPNVPRSGLAELVGEPNPFIMRGAGEMGLSVPLPPYGATLIELQATQSISQEMQGQPAQTTTPNELQAPLTISEEMRRLTAQVPTPSAPASGAISRNYLGKPLPKDPRGNEYYYEYPTDRRQNGKPAIWSAGPDRIPETKDDITNWK